MVVLTDEGMMRAARVMQEAADRMAQAMMRLDQINMQLERFELAVERLVSATAPDNALLEACKAVRADASVAEALSRPFAPENLPVAVEAIRSYLNRIWKTCDVLIAANER